MFSKNHQSLIGAATLLTALGTFADSSFAQKPEPVIRTFGFLVSNGEDASPPPPAPVQSPVVNDEQGEEMN